MSTGRGHVLVISHGYEPMLHVSGTRATHMAPELTAIGWEVTVLTVDWSDPPRPRIADVDGSVERSLTESSPRRLAIDGRLSNPDFDPRDIETSVPESSRSPLKRKVDTFRNILGWGPYAPWAKRAHDAAARLHSHRPIDVSWAIHGDDSSHAIAHRLKQRLGIPWVADYKDPWDAFHSDLALTLQRWVTRRRLRGADGSTETCAAQAAADEHTFGRRPAVVYSGYDAELMEGVMPERSGGGFCVAYMGAFGNSHDTCMLRDVFSELAQRGCIESGEFEVYQYGSSIGQIRGLLGEAGCASIAREFDRVPRPRVFSLMRGADVLLILPLTSSKGRLVGLKEIESFASGSPVLVLGEPLAELMPVVRACPQVHVALTPEEGADFLEAESGRVRAGASSRGEVNIPALEPFTWSVQASRLSELLVRCRRRPPSRTSESRAA